MPDEVVCLGDYFDSFTGTVADTLQTARWVASRIHVPGWHFLMGNHEAQYRWPKSPWHITKAYTADKQKAISSVIDDNAWRRMLFAVQRGDWWITHAGLHPAIFVHPVLGFDPDRVWDTLHRAEFEAHAGIYTSITDEQRSPDGTPSGPLWLRWHEFVPIEGVNQVVGHTPHDSPVKLDGSENWDIDTGLNHYAILEDGRLTVHPVSV